jgi:aminoglycoside phosphotransferase (APT) family kinase protein
MESPAIEGIDVEPVTRWFKENVAPVRAPLDFELIAGGRSNLTFRVTDAGGRQFVLRRPPIAHVLATAHDMGREHRIISALGPTDVPVPEAVGYCGDESVNGRPFYVMSYLEGIVVRDANDASELLDVPGRRRAGQSLADVLAEIHSVDVDEVGLGDLARRDGYIERQLKRWQSQVDQSRALTGRSIPVLDEVHDILASNVPAQRESTIVHGDYRLDNTMLEREGQVMAVLDWEICTLGDPLADLGLLMVYWTGPADEAPLGVAPTAVEGFPSRAEMVERYVSRSGRDASNLDYFVAFGYWKLACIVEGVHARYAGGAGGGDRSGVDAFADQVVRLAGAARATAANL